MDILSPVERAQAMFLQDDVHTHENEIVHDPTFPPQIIINLTQKVDTSV